MASLNAMYFKDTTNNFKIPGFVETSRSSLDPDPNHTPPSILTQIVSNMSRKTKQALKASLKQRERIRKAERDLMEGVVAIVLYLILFSVIVLVSNEHSSIEQRMNSNVYLRNLIHSETSWSKVSGRCLASYVVSAHKAIFLFPDFGV